MKRRNPFLTAGYEGSETFCDRERETAELIASIENGRNTTLIAPRRYGKTGLIKNMLSKLSPEYDKVYIDIYATECLLILSSFLPRNVLRH
jgi:AAA+ ATPase superfamily predicted ATPase